MCRLPCIPWTYPIGGNLPARKMFVDRWMRPSSPTAAPWTRYLRAVDVRQMETTNSFSISGVVVWSSSATRLAYSMGALLQPDRYSIDVRQMDASPIFAGNIAARKMFDRCSTDGCDSDICGRCSIGVLQMDASPIYLPNYRWTRPSSLTAARWTHVSIRDVCSVDVRQRGTTTVTDSSPWAFFSPIVVHVSTGLGMFQPDSGDRSPQLP